MSLYVILPLLSVKSKGSISIIIVSNCIVIHLPLPFTSISLLFAGKAAVLEWSPLWDSTLILGS